MASALKLKSDIKNLKAAINAKSTDKKYIPKLKSQLEKAESELASLNKPTRGRPRKTSTTKKTGQMLTSLQKLVQKTKKLAAYRGSGIDLKKDAVEGAFAVGRRVSKGLKSNQYGGKEDNKGNVYYEYRPNRYDVKQPRKKQTYPKLEDGGYMADGGMMADGGIVKNFIIQRDNGEEFVMYKRSIDKHKLTKYPMEAEIFKSIEDAEKRIERYDLEKKLGVNLIVAKVTKSHPEGLMEYLQEYEEFASGGMMASGGYMDKGGEFSKGNQVYLKENVYYTIHNMLSQNKVNSKDVEFVKQEVLKYGNKRQKDLAKKIKAPSFGSNAELMEILTLLALSLKYVDDDMAKGGYMADGGEPHRTEEYAKGGVVAHGLMKGDHILFTSENMLAIRNEIDGKYFIINIEKGERIEAPELKETAGLWQYYSQNK